MTAQAIAEREGRDDLPELGPDQMWNIAMNAQHLRDCVTKLRGLPEYPELHQYRQTILRHFRDTVADMRESLKDIN